MRAVILCFTAALLQAQPANPVFATYFGGGGYEIPGSVTTDRDGNIYVAGRTDSPDFPVKNALQPESRAFSQLFIAKFSPTGALIYSTYFGGSDNDAATSITADAAGNVYITGSLHSKDFPTTDAIQAQLGGGVDAFVLKLDSSGKVIYSTYLGGRFNDIGTSIAVDASGSAYLTGWTESPDFPTTAGAFQTQPTGYIPGRTFRHAFVTKLDPAGKIAYSTFLGGSQGDIAWSIAVDAEGQAHVAGDTSSLDFPVGGNALQRKSGKTGRYGQGADDGFLTKLKADGSGFVYSTYIGGPNNDTARSVALDAKGRAYITGTTTDGRLPILNGPQRYLGGDVLLVKQAGSDEFTARRTGLAASIVTALAFDPNVASLEYAGTPQGLFRSADGGETWTSAGLETFSIQQLVVDSTRPRTIYASTAYPGGIFRSNDAGETWTDLTAGFPGSTDGVVFQALAVDPAGTVYTVAGSGGIGAGYDQPLFRITDDGATWTLLGKGLPSTPQSVAVGPNSSLFAGTRAFQFICKIICGGLQNIPGSVYRRDSDNWVVGSIVDDIRALAFQGGTLFAAGRRLYRSRDGGATWTGSDIAGSGVVLQLAVDPRDPSSLYLLRDDTSTRELLRSRDGGESFESIGRSNAVTLAVNPFDSALHIGKIASADAFVAAFEPDGGLFYSSFAGGASAEMGDSVATDAAGNIYLAGFRSPGDFAIGYVGRTFVSRIDESGYSVDLGATGSSNILGMPCRALTVAPDGALIAVMQAIEPGLPVRGAAQQQLNGSADLYLVKWYPE